jgi:hypothetical protein
MPPPHNDLSIGAEQPRLFSGETSLPAFGTPPVQPVRVRLKFFGKGLGRFSDFDLIFPQPTLDGLMIKVPLGQKFFGRAPPEEPIINVPGGNAQLFRKFFSVHFPFPSTSILTVRVGNPLPVYLDATPWRKPPWSRKEILCLPDYIKNGTLLKPQKFMIP